MRILRNDGISVIALVIVILLMSALGFVFSSLIITKQKSAHLPLKSAQAFYAAQAGIGYAIRYAANDPNFDPDVDFLVTESLETGSFSVTYDSDSAEQSITSTGTAGTATRVITLASFPVYVAGEGITLDPDNLPCQDAPPAQKNICVPTVNNYYNCDVYIFQIDLAKEEGTQAKLMGITLGGATVWEWTGPPGQTPAVSADHNNPTDFPLVPYYTMAPGKLTDIIGLKDAGHVDGTWYLTFHYSRHTDLSDPETSTMTFVIS